MMSHSTVCTKRCDGPYGCHCNSSANFNQALSDQQFRKPKTMAAKSHKTGDRVIVPNVVYLMNLPESMANDDTLRSVRYLGQYGKIDKIILHKNGTAHATFSTMKAAQRCIKCLDNFQFNGTRISALVGTTKYPEDVDLQKIMNNTGNEAPVTPCPNPVFPSPISLSPPQSSARTDQPFSHGINNISKNLNPAHPSPSECPSFHSNISYTMNQQHPPISPRTICSNEDFSHFVFGTGGLFHSMWSDRQSSDAAFIPKVVFEDGNCSWNKLSNLEPSDNVQSRAITPCYPTKPSNLSPPPASKQTSPALTPRVSTHEDKHMEDFWSSSNSDTGDSDMEGSMLDDLTIDVSEADFVNGWISEGEVDGNGLNQRMRPQSTVSQESESNDSLSFSPCKEMVRALTAHVWEPYVGTSTNSVDTDTDVASSSPPVANGYPQCYGYTEAYPQCPNYPMMPIPYGYSSQMPRPMPYFMPMLPMPMPMPMSMPPNMAPYSYNNNGSPFNYM